MIICFFPYIQVSSILKKLTRIEALSDDELNLQRILDPSNETEEEKKSFSKDNEENSMKLGTNFQAGGKIMFLLPGTVWCGKGWGTDAKQKMGGYAGADKCCRHHDLGSPLSIEPGQLKWGLHNTRYA